MFAESCYDMAVAVPLPEVCNNPGCECLNGLSEAGAAVKACAGCGARYCLQECQKLAWHKHRAACRRLRVGIGAGFL
jgi:N6-adenosine-specific RNA methylase IME4